MADPAVLVVGAGPTGLVLALWLARGGVAVRIIDKVAEPGTTSRALAVQARTLELYRQLGLATEVVERGLKFDTVNLWSYGRHVGRARVAVTSEGITPFPHAFIFPQDQHERLLIERLQRAGVVVERPAELLDFEDDGSAVKVRIKPADGSVETCRASFLVGCDGARSMVREVLGVGFPGGTYQRVFYVADAQISGPIADHELHVALDDADFLASFPLKAEGAARLIGTVLEESQLRSEQLTWDDVSHRAVDRLGVKVERINWFSTYRVHHRVASHFQRGRVFLAGDAAHIHSPVGGQGMNTGIGDAINLAWKLVDVVRNPAAAPILQTYEPERIAFARRLVATTDRIFTLVTRDGFLARFVRRRVVPALVPPLLSVPALRRYAFLSISQTRINYRGSMLSVGRAGKVHGGDRLPWVPPEPDGGADNFTPLESLQWQLHVYGDAAPGLTELAGERGIPVVRFMWRDAMRKAGFARNTAYLVRPDGYVAAAGADRESLAAYFARPGLNAVLTRGS